MPITFKDVAEILRIIDASQCEEVVIELEGLRLIVRRGNPERALVGEAAGPGGSEAAKGTPLRSAPGPGLKRAKAELLPAAGRLAVRAPMVGTFYRRPSPEAQPFVEVGTRVAQGDSLCLIEVMKLYTTIAAPADGVLEAIAVEDGAAVEFDQLLFVIRPDA
jgi:acetyl-CoA carboxylase biotin carboxyl carrier protein